MRQIILRDPVPKIGWKQKRLTPITVYKFAHARILYQNHPKVRQTANPDYDEAERDYKLKTRKVLLRSLEASGFD